MEDGLPADLECRFEMYLCPRGMATAGEGSGASIAPAVVAASCSMMSKLIAATQLCVGHNVYLRVGVVAVYYAEFVAASRKSRAPVRNGNS